MNRDEHIDAMLALAMVDCETPWNPEPMTIAEIAKKVGADVKKISEIELNALNKMKKNPDAWDALMALKRR